MRQMLENATENVNQVMCSSKCDVGERSEGLMVGAVANLSVAAPQSSDWEDQING